MNEGYQSQIQTETISDQDNTSLAKFYETLLCPSIEQLRKALSKESPDRKAVLDALFKIANSADGMIHIITKNDPDGSKSLWSLISEDEEK